MKTLGRTSVLSSQKRLLQMAPVNPFNFPETLWHLQGVHWPATGQRIYVRSNDWNMHERCSLVHIGDWHAHEISTIWGSAKRLEICFLVRNIFIKMMTNHAHAVDGTSFSCPSWCWTCQWHQHGTTSSEPWSWQLAPSSVCRQQRAHHPCTQWNLGAECRHTWRPEFRQVLDGNDAVGTTPHHLPDTPIGVYTFLILSEYWLTPAPNVRKVANRCVFSMIRGSWCSKSRLAKAVGAEVAVQQRHEKWHAAVARRAFCRSKCTKHLSAEPILDVTMSKNGTPAEAHFQVKIHNTPHDRTDFGSVDREKWHAAVAQSAFASQAKSAKRHMIGPIFEVPIRKNGTPLSREAHLQVKMWKNWRVGPLFNVPISKNDTPLWREAHLQVKICKTLGFWDIFGAQSVD